MSIARQRGPVATSVIAPVEIGGRRAATFDVSRLPQHSTTGRRVGQAIDLVTASVGLVLGLVPALCIALLVKLTSRGPVFFVQERVGQGGELFRVYKFRTMRDGTHAAVLADEQLRAQYVQNGFKLPPDDPRITPVGRFLRKTSLDEMPQLLNVLRGEMSMVGIRPLLEGELALRPPYDQALYRMMRPGLTGLWQVMGRSTIGTTDRLELDRSYVENWSVVGDLKILFRTPIAILRTHQAH